jgi:ribonucleoside-triphosphate reductase (formate)
MAYLRVTYDQQFDDLMMYLRSKYPRGLFDLDGIGHQLDMSLFSRRFFNNKGATSDVSVDDNSNIDNSSVIVYNNELPKPWFKLNSYYILWKTMKKLYGLERANEIIESQLTGDIYINDFHGVGSGMPYCFNYSTYDVAVMGLPMIGKIISVPPKYLYSFKSQLEQFVVIASNSTLGATGLADLFIVMGHYVDKIFETGGDAGISLRMATPEETEANVWRYVKETLVSFIYTINQPMRANQSPFTNVSVFDRFFLENLCPGYDFDGKTPRIETVQKIQELFIDTMNEEMERTPVTFPVTTACFSIDDHGNIQDEDFLRMIAEKDMKFGFINIYHGKSSTLSSCCRLRSDMEMVGNIEVLSIDTEDGKSFTFKENDRIIVKNLEDSSVGEIFAREIVKSKHALKTNGEFHKVTNLGREKEKNTEALYSNSFGAGSTKIGSLGVVTVNFPRLAYRNRGDVEKFMEELVKVTNNCARINHAKRSIVKKRIENGNLPLYSLAFMDLSRQFSTVGVNGLNEACEIMGFDILKDDGQEFILRCLRTINDCNDKNQRQYGAPHNCEQIPGESSSIKLAKKDKLLKVQSDDLSYDIYSNQFIPLVTRADMLDRIKLQGKFDKHFSGGAICHVNVENEITDSEFLADLIRACAKMGVVYWAVNYNLARCRSGHTSVGKVSACMTCGSRELQNFTRVVGYLSATKNWNRERRERDYPNRQWYGVHEEKEEEMYEVMSQPLKEGVG